MEAVDEPNTENVLAACQALIVSVTTKTLNHVMKTNVRSGQIGQTGPVVPSLVVVDFGHRIGDVHNRTRVTAMSKTYNSAWAPPNAHPGPSGARTVPAQQRVEVDKSNVLDIATEVLECAETEIVPSETDVTTTAARS